MNTFTFKRGIHPNDSKSLTNKKEIIFIQPKIGAEMIFPMQQHLGAPCEPIVSIGEKVLLGQKIADSKAFVSSPIHSSVSGVVKEFRKTLTPNGIKCDAIVIENDGLLTEHPSLNSVEDYTKFEKDKILALIRDAGIVGLGGAGFPTHIKLNPAPDKKIDTIIVNAAECEPYLTTDHRVLLEESDRIIRGLKVVLQIFKGAKGIIAIETNKMDAIEKLEEMTKDIENIEIARLVPKYPQGAEKQLIIACTGRVVPAGGLPADIGVIVDNVDTIIAIDRAVVRRRPLIRKIVTITGGAVKNPGNFKVRLGMSYKDLLDATGGFTENPYKMISGGPMMGVAMYTLDVPFIKTSSALICFTEKEAFLPPERNCIRCGKCVEHCPISLMPLELNQNVIHNEFDLFIKNNGLNCIECGSCSYVCPAKRHLAQSIRVTRRDLMSKKKN